MDFNFTDPMVLSNAMIFHDSLTTNQFEGKSSYIPPIYPSFPASEYSRGSYNAAFEYKMPCPIEDSLNSPIIIEDIINNRKYLEMVLGLLEDNLIVSVSLNNPRLSELETIFMFIKGRISDFKEKYNACEAIIVISGKMSKEFYEKLKGAISLPFTEIDNKLIIKMKT